jgi:hypothetical protein
MTAARTAPLFGVALFLTAPACNGDDDTANKGGGDSTPSYCEQICPAVVEPGCTNGPDTVDDCEDGCTESQRACPTQFGAVRDCTGTTATFTCDANESPVVAGCETEHTALGACAQVFVGYCDRMCEAVSGLPCEPTNCLADCAATSTQCSSEYDAAVRCSGAEPVFSCTAGNAVTVSGCESQYAALDTCDETPGFCATACPSVVAANCENGPSLADCQSGCAESMTECPSEFAALQTCSGDSPSFSCHSSGLPIADGCASQHMSLYECSIGPLECFELCPEIVGAGCANGPDDMDDCVSGCARGAAVCPVVFDGLVSCVGETPSVTCDPTTQAPTVTGCETQFGALLACIPD